ncbi:MAG: 5-(carboxyamino)imidazole ribonucleotide mutase [Proteocatella sp.]
MKVAIILGSVSDFSKIREACDYLKKMGVEFDLRALSAHRTGQELENYMKENDENIDVYIAAAGKAAHLPGVIAAKTIKPVIGIPVKSSSLDGMDALLSIVQMPSGVPVATVAIDGAKNAAILACQMLAITNKELASKLNNFKLEMANQVLLAEKKLIEEIGLEYGLKI